MLKFINTLEIAPSDYAINDYDSPKGSIVENAVGWYDYWKKSLKDSNLQNLEPIEKGCFLVDVDTISDFELKIIIHKNANSLEEDIDLLCGGIVVMQDNELLIAPSCCGDLGCLSNWEKIFSTKENEWTQLWIGHPWIFYKRNNNFVAFSDYSDVDLVDDFEVKFEVSEVILKDNIKIIREKQNDLLAKVTKILNKS